MPIWFTILASILAALGAYWISPAINRQFQVDQIRSAHIEKTTQNLNSEIIALSTKIRRLNEALINEGSDVSTIRGDSLDLITKLQWMLVDLKVVLKSDEDRRSVEELSAAINQVQAALNRAVDKRAEPELLAAMDTLGRRTQDVLNRLYVRASLKSASDLARERREAELSS